MLAVPRIVHSLSTVVCLFVAGAAFADVCQSELEAAVQPGEPPVRVATALARTALEAIEPALPFRQEPTARWQDDNARWLDRQGFLPKGWDDDGELTADLWSQLLTNIQEPYRVGPRRLSGKTDPDTLLSETGSVLAAIGSAVRPLALIATSPDAEHEIAFASVIWNWTPQPRLLLFDPSALAIEPGGELSDALPSIGTCAWQPEAYISTDANTAANYFLGSDDSQFRILATDLGQRGELVPSGQETEVLRFQSDLLEGASVASLAVEGKQPTPWEGIRFMTTAEANVGPFELRYYLAFP